MNWLEMAKKMNMISWEQHTAAIADLLAENIADTIAYTYSQTGERLDADSVFDSEYQALVENLDWEMGKMREEICGEAMRRLRSHGE